NAYGRWAAEAGTRSGYSVVESLDELKATGAYAVVTPDECIELARRYRRVMLHPLMGGTPPELGWRSLKLVVEKVWPRLGGLSACLCCLRSAGNRRQAGSHKL